MSIYNPALLVIYHHLHGSPANISGAGDAEDREAVPLIGQCRAAFDWP